MNFYRKENAEFLIILTENLFLKRNEIILNLLKLYI